MKVAVNARILSGPTLRGWSRYTINLLAELPAHGVELLLLTDQPLNESHLARLPQDSFRVRLAPKMPYIKWEQYWIPQQCAADQVDLLHTPFNFGLPFSSQCPRVLTLHDAIGRLPGGVLGLWRQSTGRGFLQTELYHWISRRRADQVITVSEYSKNDLISKLGVDGSRISVIYEAADHQFHQPVLQIERRSVRERYTIPAPYVFYVGGWEERKNVPFLLRAFADANFGDVQLVLAGGLDEQRAELAIQVEKLGLGSSVRLLGWVADADLPALYAEALCFVYPSSYEGFGLQMCEAMAAGCPTFAARATCLPEVLGSGGDTFALDDPAELTSLLQRVALEAPYRADLVARAKRRSVNFSWSTTAQQTVALYRKTVNRS